jgi:hypothetical protein
MVRFREPAVPVEEWKTAYQNGLVEFEKAIRAG